jgi:hypothetical protein
VLRAVSEGGTGNEKIWTYARTNVPIYLNGVVMDWKRVVTVTDPEGGVEEHTFSPMEKRFSEVEGWINERSLEERLKDYPELKVIREVDQCRMGSARRSFR